MFDNLYTPRRPNSSLDLEKAFNHFLVKNEYDTIIWYLINSKYHEKVNLRASELFKCNGLISVLYSIIADKFKTHRYTKVPTALEICENSEINMDDICKYVDRETKENLNHEITNQYGVSALLRVFAFKHIISRETYGVDLSVLLPERGIIKNADLIPLIISHSDVVSFLVDTSLLKSYFDRDSELYFLSVLIESYKSNKTTYSLQDGYDVWKNLFEIVCDRINENGRTLICKDLFGNAPHLINICRSVDAGALMPLTTPQRLFKMVAVYTLIIKEKNRNANSFQIGGC